MPSVTIELPSAIAHDLNEVVMNSVPLEGEHWRETANRLVTEAVALWLEQSCVRDDRRGIVLKPDRQQPRLPARDASVPHDPTE